MFGGWLQRNGILLLLVITMIAPARADDPAAQFKLLEDATITSPDQQLRVEQYAKEQEDQSRLYQFWTFDKDGHGFLLNPGENDELAGYAAGFRFSPDSQWLVRMQKLGAGYHTIFLYRRNGNRFSAAATKPLGDLAWNYFFSRPASKPMHRNAKDRDSLDHAQANLVRGLEDNFTEMGQHWPDSRYLVISLSFDTQGEHPRRPWIEDWRCVYDMKTGAFSVPADFADHNRTVVKTFRSDQK
jgi:hypothetical protein